MSPGVELLSHIKQFKSLKILLQSEFTNCWPHSSFIVTVHQHFVNLLNFFQASGQKIICVFICIFLFMNKVEYIFINLMGHFFFLMWNTFGNFFYWIVFLLDLATNLFVCLFDVLKILLGFDWNSKGTDQFGGEITTLQYWLYSWTWFCFPFGFLIAFR